MPIDDPNALIAQIRAIDLTPLYEPPQPLVLALGAGAGPSRDNGLALESFVADVTPARRADTLDSVLFAQLGASHIASRRRATLKWYDAYLTMLNKLGWGMQNTGRAQMPPTWEGLVKFDFGTLLPAGQAGRIRSLIEAADASRVDATFSAQGVSLGRATESGGTVELSLSAFDIRLTKTYSSGLFDKIGSFFGGDLPFRANFVFSFGRASGQLDLEHYDVIRDVVREKLESNTIHSVANADL